MQNHAWLCDVRSNPYAEQLARGFRRLRFPADLESEYRAYRLEDSFELKCTALGFAVLAWLALAAVDFLLIPGAEHWTMLAVRGVVLVLLVICAALILQRRFAPLMVPLSIACILAVGIGAALVVGIAHRVDHGYPYEGLLLVSMAAYFLVGLRFSEALASAVLILLAYLGCELYAGLTLAKLVNNLVFLLLGNLVGAVGCYLLEYKSREYFLSSQLLRQMAEHDALTGLRNRRSFDRQLERLWRQAQRDDAPLALLLCDVDHFKAYNDRYGHQAGDSVLQRIAQALQESARRPLDMAVRLGGEEFAVLLYGADAEEARQRAQVLCAAVQALGIRHEGSTTAEEVTLSIGVSCLRPGAQIAWPVIYAHADRALYEAKAFGRNQVVV
ncbi:GGDEF domain-containing protein [Pseudomonas panipatensis]|uniref:diguanylate cyclase n=1 Tax=Pseudomonas panipatensis TaxID=428992 RepID=A0A1G8GI51_9PSED|nr:GGDEF domain-containing protein [Pseudomonas panipatensis]SDH94099.1 diguanylate cyclase (GGDEF) domain-containing protein [Pseudomonas panipatensis]SMP43127.1 diguanylate cyclase (GGDEF) domain-containing protein [Pseudomonas panipatensis]